MRSSLHIAFVATECFPFIKVGGLADVIGSLPAALAASGARVDVVIPGFRTPTRDTGARFETLPTLAVPGDGSPGAAQVRSTRLPGSQVRVFAIEDGGYFPRRGLYVDPDTGQDYPDQPERWTFFQRAALELLSRECPSVDVVHCHEHQTALIPYLLERSYRPRGLFAGTSTVLTIHNLGYQGLFPQYQSSRFGLPESEIRPGGRFEFYGQINLMKGGVLSADALTVVSPTYAREIQTDEFGYGLQDAIAARRADLFGILNGIDTGEWNPQTDSRIPAPYSAENVDGKRQARRELLRTFGLHEDGSEGPVLAMVSRLDVHKGFDLVLAILGELLDDGVRFVLVGTGDRLIETGLEAIAGAHPDRASLRFAFDDTLAHKTIAGADVFLMPSKYEPCGLTQMYALRYGTIPVVRKTGGLADTVSEFDPDSGDGNGFTFDQYDAGEFRQAVDRALGAWSGPFWPRIVRNAMAAELGWDRSAARYLDVYGHAVGKRANT